MNKTTKNQPTAKAPAASSVYENLKKIRAGLKHTTLEWSPVAYLNTGSQHLNSIFGHTVRGIPYGRILELSGMESAGKTSLAMHLAAAAQREGAHVIWQDFEMSFDPDWAAAHGMDPDNVYLLQPYIGTFKTKTPTIATAEILCEEASAIMLHLHQKHPEGRIFLVNDSVASMLVAAEGDSGMTERNLRVDMALPKYMGALLRRWVGLAQATSTAMLFLNQLRENPMQMFGDPLYTPGGNALKFYAHVRARIRRAKGGKMTQGGKVVGIQGVLSNLKNKSGGTEKAQVAYKIFFNGKVKFLPAEELKKEGE